MDFTRKMKMKSKMMQLIVLSVLTLLLASPSYAEGYDRNPSHSGSGPVRDDLPFIVSNQQLPHGRKHRLSSKEKMLQTLTELKRQRVEKGLPTDDLDKKLDDVRYVNDYLEDQPVDYQLVDAIDRARKHDPSVSGEFTPEINETTADYVERITRDHPQNAQKLIDILQTMKDSSYQ